MDPPSKGKTENKESCFQYGPLRGRPEFFYEHVPLCQDDPNCFRSTCGYCHPRRDSQATHWGWVFPLEQKPPVVEPKPLRSAVPPLLFGKGFENTEPSNLHRDSSFAEDSVILPNLDFLDASDTPSPPYNPWDFNSTDLNLKNGSDGPSLHKVGSEKVLKEKKESKGKRRVQSSLRTNAPPFQPTYSSSQPSKALEITSPTIPAATPLATSISSSITTIEVATPSTASETTEPAAFLRRMEVIKLAAINTPSKPPSETSNQVSTPTCNQSSTPSTPNQETTTTTTTTTTTVVVTETCKVVENPEKKPSPPPKVIPKSKSIPVVPPFKSKITTHTRTEQENLAPLLPLRGGSSTSTTVITEIISPKSNHVPKSLPTVSNLLERDDDSSQSIDTGAKAPSRVTWFMVIWSFVCSWIADLGQDIKDMLAFVWATIILRLPFFAKSASASQSNTTKVSNTTRPLRKPTAAKHFKARPTRSDQNEGKMRK